MFEYIKGPLAEVTPTYAVVDTAAGIGYMTLISLNTYEAIMNMKGEVRLLIQEVIREDAWTLYGFAEARERDLFRLLTSVSGVGPGTAMLILSSLPPSELKSVITSGDHTRLKSVKGIGAKTAQRIIVDLKDKIKPQDDALLPQSSLPSRDSAVYEEALAALTALGFQRAQSQKVLKRVFDADPAIRVEAAIKAALGMM
ncbi:MAG: Holliday junction branch migration protein RuvA [Duncaniella sp.]|nr:Holliday junction branch migration protein RuvA [Duncaniella sp.]